jgi:hypothetical protein
MMLMPFEPQPERDDESLPDDLELALSPEHAALADRLSADADSIAARYPIEGSPAFGARFWDHAREAMHVASSNQLQPQQVVDRSRKRIVLVSSAAAACVLLSALITRRLSDEQLTDNGSASGLVAQGDSRGAQGSVEADSVLRSNILNGLSGAEQEAVLDLLEREMPIKLSFSI